MTRIDTIIADIIYREGGFSNRPTDRGGPTRFGVTQRTLAGWRGHPVTVDDVRNLSTAEAADIYTERYITAPGFLQLPTGIIDQVVDHGVLSHPRTSTRDLQTVLGVVSDGILGPITLGAARAADVTSLSNSFAARRCLRLVGIVRRDRSQGDYVVGWTRRALSFIQPQLTLSPQ